MNFLLLANFWPNPTHFRSSFTKILIFVFKPIFFLFFQEVLQLQIEVLKISTEKTLLSTKGTKYPTIHINRLPRPLYHSLPRPLWQLHEVSNRCLPVAHQPQLNPWPQVLAMIWMLKKSWKVRNSQIVGKSKNSFIGCIIGGAAVFLSYLAKLFL